MRSIETVRYHCGKIEEGVHHFKTEFESPGLALVSLNLIEDWLGELVRYVQQPEISSQWRDLLAELRDDTETIKHTITFLKMFLQNDAPSEEERLTARVFSKFIAFKVPLFFEKYKSTDDPN